MNRTELAKKINTSLRHVDYILRGERRPSPDIAKQLEEETGVDRRAWLWPDEFENPHIKKTSRKPSR